MGDNSEAVALIEKWHNKATLSQKAHYESSVFFQKFHYILGIPSVIFSTFVGTTVFIALEHNVDSISKIIVGLLSVLSAILIALQTFLRLSEKSEKHLSAGARYGSLRRELEKILTLIKSGESIDLSTTLEKVCSKMDQHATTSPTIPKNIRKKAKE